MKKLDAAKAWFRSNVDEILNIYGREHNIQREDVFLGMQKIHLYRPIVYLICLMSSHKLVTGTGLCFIREPQAS